MATRTRSVCAVGLALLAGCGIARSGPVALRQVGAAAMTGHASVTHPVRVGTLRGSDTAAGDFFGTPVAGSGSVVVVGAQLHDRQAGRVYVFTRVRSGWRQAAELAGSDTRVGDGFGGSVAVSGTTIVVGAAGADASAGRAYVFTRTASGWRQAAELRAPRGYQGGGGYADAVSVSGDTILVGEDEFGRIVGRVLVYTRSKRGWTQTAVMHGSSAGARPLALFGYMVAISGGEAIVSTSVDTVYVFHKTAAGWRQAGVLHDPLSSRSGTFGTSVAISGGTAAVGDWHDARIDVYAPQGPGWRLSAVVRDPGRGGLYDNFGLAVAMAGRVLVAGAPGALRTRAGQAYLYIRTKTRWRLAARLPGLQIRAGEWGYAAAIWGHTVAVAALGARRVKGAIYVFRI